MHLVICTTDRNSAEYQKLYWLKVNTQIIAYVTEIMVTIKPAYDKFSVIHNIPKHSE